MILAIDHGTSGCKAALVGIDGEVRAWEVEPVPTRFLPGGGAEQDPEAWWTALVAAVQRLWDRGVATPADVLGVGCSSTFSSTVACLADGTPVAPSLTWMDSRAAGAVRRALGRPPRVLGYNVWDIARWVRVTGGAPTLSGKDDVAHVLYWREAMPDAYRTARWFLSSKDWLNLRLTGRAAATHDSVGLFWLADTRDIDRVRWHTGLMARLGLDPARFPPLLRSIDVLGPLADGAADALGLPRGTPVVAGAADLQSCCVGSGAVRDGEAHLYVGTSSWVLYHTPRRRLDALHSIASLPSAIPGRYFVATEQDMAGGALEFALRNLGLGTGPEGFAAVEAALANTAPGAAGVLFTPWLNGEKTPVDDESLRGGFHGLGVATTRDDLLRAVVEGVALNARWLLLHLDRLAGGRLDPLNAVGGGVQSDGWSQVYADVLGRTVRRVRHPRAANARGAAWIAAVGLGRLRFDDLPALVRFDGVFEPRPAHRAVYDDAFRRFLRAWKATRAIR